MYISPAWMVAVFKGVIRHEHSAMLKHFQTTGDRDNLRRTRRLCVFGELHKELLPYLWPTATPYWELVRQGAAAEAWSYEHEIWSEIWDVGAAGSGLVIRDRAGQRAALRLLQHFKLMSAEHNLEFLVGAPPLPARNAVCDPARSLRSLAR